MSLGARPWERGRLARIRWERGRPRPHLGWERGRLARIRI